MSGSAPDGVGEDIRRGRRNAQLSVGNPTDVLTVLTHTSSLPLVPDGQDCLPRAYETAGESADRGVPDDVRDPEQRCGGDDGFERQRAREDQVGQCHRLCGSCLGLLLDPCQTLTLDQI